MVEHTPQPVGCPAWAADHLARHLAVHGNTRPFLKPYGSAQRAHAVLQWAHELISGIRVPEPEVLRTEVQPRQIAFMSNEQDEQEIVLFRRPALRSYQAIDPAPATPLTYPLSLGEVLR